MTTEQHGYCAKYVVMDFEDTHVIDGNQCQHDPADWLEERYGKVHPIPTILTTTKEKRIIPNTESSTKHEMTGDSEILVKNVRPPRISEHDMPMAPERDNFNDCGKSRCRWSFIFAKGSPVLFSFNWPLCRVPYVLSRLCLTV